MLLDTIFAPFVKERPICVMARAVLERLLDAQRLDALFARTAERQYTHELLFSSLVQLMSEVVLGVHPTVHAAYQANQDAIGVSTTALYNTLDRVEPGVSAALVCDSAALAEPVVKALGASHPRWVPGYQIKVLDGNHLAATAHRLKALRSTWAAPLPGQVLVVLDQQRMLITDVLLSEEGHAQERSLIPAVLQRVEADQLWSEDRNFCPLGLLFGLARRGAAFVVRQHGQVQGELLGRAQRTGTTRSGPVYEQAMQGRDRATGETMRLRRITLQLKVATRAGDTALHILSNVPSGRGSAAQLARVYGKRWSIGVSSEGHSVQSVEVRPRRKDSGLVAWEAPWRENKTVEPSDNRRRKAHAQHTRLQRAVNAAVASSHAIPVAETVDNARRQQGLSARSPIRQLSPAGYQRRHGVKETVSTGEALGVRRSNLAEEAVPITVRGKWRRRHQGGGSGRSTVDGRAAQRARREGPGPVSTPFVQVRQG